MESGSDPSVFENRFLYKAGLLAHDYRKLVFSMGLIICLSLGSMSVFLVPEWSEAFGEGDIESANGFAIMDQSFSSSEDQSAQRFYILVRHNVSYNDSIIQESVIDTLAPIASDSSVSITYPWTVDQGNISNFVSDDGQYSRTLVLVSQDRSPAKIFLAKHWQEMVNAIDTAEEEHDLEIWITADLATDTTFDMRLKQDLISSEVIALPFVFMLLLIVFGSFVAAFLPLGIGVLTVISALGITIWLSTLESTNVNNFASNIITLLGVGVSIDYSLFIVYRYREELSQGHDTRTAIAITTATAGKAVVFSGCTVAVGLLGLLFFVNTECPSFGIGGTLAVSMAMLTSVIMLPALLAMLGPKINSLRVPFGMKDTVAEDGIWSTIATTVMKRPLTILIPILILLVGAGTPFLQAEYGITSIQSLPPDDMSRNGLDEMKEIWSEGSDNNIFLIIELEEDTDPLSPENIREVHTYASQIYSDNQTFSVLAPGFVDPNMDANSTITFWQTPSEFLTVEQNAQRESLRETFFTTKSNHTWILVTLSINWNTPEAFEYVEQIRSDRDAGEIELFGAENEHIIISGLAAYNVDMLNAVVDNLPTSMIFIFISTCILLFLQVRSVIIPLKAIMMNILSITATFGMLVFVFQEGSLGLDEIMNFTPQPINPTTPVMLFCIVFGLSMDYEVLMLSRIHEEWERTGDNTKAVAMGLQKTGRLITAAALIMILVFSAQIFASIAVIKQFGLGLALAIFVDATFVRALVVPATMRLMGPLNWWAPSFLQKKSSKNNSNDDGTES